MIWKAKAEPKFGDTRRRTFFAWLPYKASIGPQWVWLERVRVEEQWVRVNASDGWKTLYTIPERMAWAVDALREAKP